MGVAFAVITIVIVIAGSARPHPMRWAYARRDKPPGPFLPHSACEIIPEVRGGKRVRDKARYEEPYCLYICRCGSVYGEGGEEEEEEEE